MALNQKQKQYLYDEVFKAAFHKQKNHFHSMNVKAAPNTEFWHKTNRALAPIRENNPSAVTVAMIRKHVDETFFYEEGIVITDGLTILLVTHGFTDNSPLPPNKIFNITSNQCTELRADESYRFGLLKSIKLMEIDETYEKGQQGFAVKPTMSINPDVFKHVLSVKEVYKLVKRIGLMDKLNIQ